MYRKRNGSISFSLSRMISNAVPNFASESAGYTVVTPQRRDMLYAHQMSTATPEALDARSFYVVGVCDRERQSERIQYALWKNGCLRDEDGTVDTTKIGPKFIHQLAFLGQQAQKNLINVLFYWEEEIQRMRKLKKEEEELNEMIAKMEKSDTGGNGEEEGEGAGEEETEQRAQANGELDEEMDAERNELDKERLDQLKFARERVRMKMRQRPTQRLVEFENDTDATVAEAFQLTRRTTEAPPAGLPPSYAMHNPQGLPRHWSIS